MILIGDNTGKSLKTMTRSQYF